LDLEDSLKLTGPRASLTRGNRIKQHYADASTVGIAATVFALLLCLSERSISMLPRIFVLVLILASVLQFVSRWVWRAEDLLGRIGDTRMAILLCGFTGMAAAAALSLLGSFPLPDIFDEFSYLLAADTFAHGRLTNPQHPMWIHFESFFIIQTPTYASKYPPGQGLILALGQVLGHPVIGVWISTGLLCGALFWMFKQWVPTRWAVLGALLASLHPELLHWAHGYWGGQLAMAGGAMMLGAVRRSLHAPQPRDGLIAGAGIAFMAFSRPYEGFVLTAVTALVVLVWSRMRPETAPILSWARFALSSLGILLPAGLAMAFYNYRVTGQALTLPYVLHEARYNPVPLFLWQRLRPIPPYNHADFYYVYADLHRRAYDAAHTVSGFMNVVWGKTKKYTDWYFLGFTPIFALITVPAILRPDKHLRLAAIILILFYAGPLAETWASGSHYLAPAASLCFLVPLMAMRHWRVWRWKGLRLGLLFTRAVILVILFLLLRNFLTGVQVLRGPQNDWSHQRAQLIRMLDQQGGRHLVIVHYLPGHPPLEEWVYNGADIDGAAVIWARDMGAEKNRELVNYFPDRRVWLLDAGPSSGSFAPYSEALDAQVPSPQMPL
jgi:hypothetical protein